MRSFMFIAALAICGFANDGFAGEQQKGVELKFITPCDLLLGTGVFIQDTGKNVVGGVRTTVKGLGELITAPLRAKILVPKRRTFRFTPPEFRLIPGEWEELKPPAIYVPPPAPLDNGDIYPLRFLPAPAGRYKNLA